MGWLTWRVGAAWAVVLVIAVVIAWLVLPPRQTGKITLPSDDATPGEVVTAYLDALEGHDCEAAEALTSWDRSFDPSSWCKGLRDISDRTVGAATRPSSSGTPRVTPGSVALVPASFVLSWRRFRDDDVSPGARFRGSFLLVRSSARDPWRIYDQSTATPP